MTTSILEISKQTTELFEKGLEKELPVPPPKFKDHIAALKEARLTAATDGAIFDMRCWQAAALGLTQMSNEEIVLSLMGEPHTHSGELRTDQEFEWAYSHHEDREWHRSMSPWYFDRIVKETPWWKPPFCPVRKWRVVGGVVNYLKKEIPYGIVLRMNELRKLKIFNCFMAFAPEAAWRSMGAVDPIIVGRISECARDNEAEERYLKGGKQATFFIGRWE